MSTLVDLIGRRAAEQPDRTAYRYLEDGDSREQQFSYREFDARVRAIAGRLQQEGIAQGDRVLLLYPSGLDYIAAFFGCLFAGAVAVPAYAPRPKGPNGRLDAIAKDARPSAALTTEEILSTVREQPAGDFAPRKLVDEAASRGLQGFDRDRGFVVAVVAPGLVRTRTSGGGLSVRFRAGRILHGAVVAP